LQTIRASTLYPNKRRRQMRLCSARQRDGVRLTCTTRDLAQRRNRVG
jgi:hypothetical protein